MASKYHIGQIHYLFEDDYRTIIHEKIVDMPETGSLAAFSLGHRVELHDTGTKFLGTVKDVKHVIMVDDSGNYTDNVFVHCGSSYEVA